MVFLTLLRNLSNIPVSATRDKDFVTIHEEVTITSGDTKCYTLMIVDDTETESLETLFVGVWDLLNSGALYHIIDVVIVDNDGKLNSQKILNVSLMR